MESMGVATGCGCKEVYRFHHTTYPNSSSFLQQHPYFLFIFKMFNQPRALRSMQDVSD